MGSEKYIHTRFHKILEMKKNTKVFDQISGRREFLLNLLQKRSIERSFW